MLKRGFGILFAKVGFAALVAITVGKLFGGNLWGYTTLALMAAMNDTNGGMFLALTSVMGDKDDAGTYVPQSIETGPFVTMLVLVGAGLAHIPWLTMVSVIAPIAAGAVLGNLDEDLRKFFSSQEPLIVPFMGFMLGQNINLMSVVHSGLPGVALGLFVLVTTGTVCILADLLLGGSGIAGAAASSTAGNAAAVIDHSVGDLDAVPKGRFASAATGEDQYAPLAIVDRASEGSSGDGYPSNSHNEHRRGCAEHLIDFAEHRRIPSRPSHLNSRRLRC